LTPLARGIFQTTMGAMHGELLGNSYMPRLNADLFVKKFKLSIRAIDSFYAG
jgi:hypothetical protein